MELDFWRREITAAIDCRNKAMAENNPNLYANMVGHLARVFGMAPYPCNACPLLKGCDQAYEVANLGRIARVDCIGVSQNGDGQ